MFDIAQFRELIVKSTLNDLNMYSPEAEDLLIFTCAVESYGGTFLKQINGPALGIYQLEPDSYNDLWQNYIKFNVNLCMILNHNFNVSNQPPPERLIYDLRFATAMARLFYHRVKEPLPSATNTIALYQYYKKHYNSKDGAAQIGTALKSYQHFLQD